MAPLVELVSWLTGYAHARRAELIMTPISCPEFPSGWRVSVEQGDRDPVATEGETLRDACAGLAIDLNFPEGK